PEGSAIILTSLAGFVTLQPDYIGFGDSLAEYHPFVMKKSLASVTIDFIYAAKKFASDNGINLNGQLFLTGYSEGGYAALATLQSIESDDKLQVTMAAPMAGPYDVNTTAFSMLSQDIMPIPSYMADIAYSYALTYNQPIESIVNEPYASQLADLFSGEYERVVVDTYLTTQTTGADGLFNPLFVQDFFTNDTNWFREAIVVNSVHAWAPQTSVRLVHCKGDDVIPFGMSELTEGTMKAYGANDVAVMPVEALLGIEELGHVACGLPAYSLTAQLFTTVRQATMKY
ncbi:MAG: lipase family protein, partial [Campylobacterota bacterium]|nr:lipase family protein [Campylobacterota bacterium]